MSKKNKKDSIEYLIDYYKGKCYNPYMFFPATATIMASDDRKVLYIRGLDLVVNCLILDESYKKREVECTTNFGLENGDQMAFNVYMTGMIDTYMDKVMELISNNTKSINPDVKMPTIHDAEGFIQLIPKNMEVIEGTRRWNGVGPQYQTERMKFRNGMDWCFQVFPDSSDSDFEESIITALHVSGKAKELDYYDYQLNKLLDGTVDINMIDAVYGLRDYVNELSGIDMSTTEIAVMLYIMNRITEESPFMSKKYGWAKNWVDSAIRAKGHDHNCF